MHRHGDSEWAVDAVINRAVALHRIGQLDEASLLYADVLQTEPQDFDALQLLGAICVDKQRFEEAVGYLRRAISIDDSFSTAHYNLGIALLELRKYAESIASLEAAIALQPHYAEAYQARANALARVGKIKEAIVSCDRALTLQPGYELARRSRTILLSIDDDVRHRRSSETLM